MTDQIELPPVPQSPPIVSLAGMADAPPIIKFNRSLNLEMLVNLDVRDEDLTETLRVRWRIISKEPAPGTPENQYPCPEPTIVGDGASLTPNPFPLRVQGSSFARGKCSRVDVVVSSSFKMCRPDRADEWDITTQEDDESDIGRLSFFVWETSDSPTTQPAATLAILTSCPQADYLPPSPTASSTSAVSLEQ